MKKSVPYVWDYEITPDPFQEILVGHHALGRLDQDGAARRLIEHAPYTGIVRRLGFRRLVAYWPRWRAKIRSYSRRRGIDFLVVWLPEKHPELVRE